MTTQSDLLDVAVYGTLKRGERNHALVARATPMGAYRSAPHYALYDLGSYPAAVAGGEQALQLEIYRVDAEQLAALDALEGHPVLYRRKRRNVPGFGPVWLYEMDVVTVAKLFGLRARRLPQAQWPPQPLASAPQQENTP